MTSRSGSSGPAVLAVCLVTLVLPAGCQTVTPVADRPGRGADACADRLHALCGKLMSHYAARSRLPDSLEALEKWDGDAVPLVCPRSGKPYQYVAAGPAIPGRPGRLVLYDSTPAHAGKRWAVVFGVTKGNQPLSARVILVDDAFVRAAAGPR